MPLNFLLGGLAALSLAITLWQWAVGRRFPLHARIASGEFTPPVSILKPLKGTDVNTPRCLESWLKQEYPGPVQILFGVASTDDPVCPIVQRLLELHPNGDAQLVVCSEVLGPNAKVSTLAQLQRHARHDLMVISDADVQVTTDTLANLVEPLRDSTVGLVNCFYRLANPATVAMQWEAVAINADFWTQVLQARSLGPLDFALGAAMATTRRQLEGLGGFGTLVDHLADDYQLGQRIARNGGTVVISPVVVECHEAPKGWRAVWTHQLRWARTIRVCRPVPYFFSILGNATLWPLLWMLPGLRGADPSPRGGSGVVWLAAFLIIRVWTAVDSQSRLNQSRQHYLWWWLVPIKDLLGVGIWAASFLGNHLEWRGRRYRVGSDGRLTLVAGG